VVPAHSFKYIAELQHKHKGGNPVFIRIETDAGHGAGVALNKTIQATADVYSFILYNTNSPVKY
jgi:prolyl oligopeptidase